MPKFLQITFSDGNTYRIPADLIANCRAKYYANNDIIQDAKLLNVPVVSLQDRFDSIFKEEFEFTMRHNLELIDWAANNMNWNDVKEVAELVKVETIHPSYEKEWTNANMRIVSDD